MANGVLLATIAADQLRQLAPGDKADVMRLLKTLQEGGGPETEGRKGRGGEKGEWTIGMAGRHAIVFRSVGESEAMGVGGGGRRVLVAGMLAVAPA